MVIISFSFIIRSNSVCQLRGSQINLFHWSTSSHRKSGTRTRAVFSSSIAGCRIPSDNLTIERATTAAFEIEIQSINRNGITYSPEGCYLVTTVLSELVLNYSSHDRSPFVGRGMRGRLIQYVCPRALFHLFEKGSYYFN